MTDQSISGPTDAEWEALAVVAPRDAWRVEAVTGYPHVFIPGWNARHEAWTVQKRWHRVEDRTSYLVELGWDGYEQSYAGDRDLRTLLEATRASFTIFLDRVEASRPTPPGDPFLYAVEGDLSRLQPFDHVLDDLTEDEGQRVLVHEFRQSEATDIDIDRLLDDVWSTMQEWAQEADHGAFGPFGHDEGAARLGPLDNEMVRHTLRYALGAAVRTSADMSDAAWTPTGRVAAVAADGFWQWQGKPT